MAAGAAGRVCVCVEARGPAEALEALERGLRALRAPDAGAGPGGGARGGLRWHGRAPRPGEGGGAVLSVSVAGTRVGGGAGEEEEACGALRALLPPRGPPVELEVLLTAPCPVPLCPDWTLEGALRVSGAEGRAPWGPDAEAALADAGLFAAPGALGGGTLEKLRELCDGRIRAADAALAARGVGAGEATFAFREVASRGGQRFDLLLLEQEEAGAVSGPHPREGSSSPRAAEAGAGAGGLLGAAAEEAFLQRVAREAPWTPLVARVLGGRGRGVRLWVSVVYSRPGAPPQEWHADGPHVGRCAGWDSGDGGGEAPPYALCVFVPLCDLSQEVGFTQFWPGTHRHDQLLGFGGACEVLGAHCDGLLRAGDALVYDYRLMHRGMPNRSPGGPGGRQRAILQFFYHDAGYAERRNYGDAALFARA